MDTLTAGEGEAERALLGRSEGGHVAPRIDGRRRRGEAVLSRRASALLRLVDLAIRATTADRQHPQGSQETALSTTPVEHPEDSARVRSRAFVVRSPQCRATSCGGAAVVGHLDRRLKDCRCVNCAASTADQPDPPWYTPRQSPGPRARCSSPSRSALRCWMIAHRFRGE